MYFVLRNPIILEDEGRHQYMASFNSTAEAEDFIERQVDNGKYKKQDFTIARPERSF